jgi:hypothetical protein
MKKLKFKQENWVIASLALMSWVFIAWNMQIGFKSCVDEAFFVLGLNPEQPLGIQHSQFFQIARFIFKVFSLDPIVINSRIVSYICVTISLLLFSVASYYWLYKKGIVRKMFILYASLVFLSGLFIFLSALEVVFSFNYLMIFLTVSQIAFYLVADVCNKLYLRRICISACGFFSFLGILNYFPSGVIVSCCLLGLILLKGGRNWKDNLLSLFLYAAGWLACAVAYNFLIYPVVDAVNEIVAHIKNPSFGVGGYDMLSYLYRIINYIDNFIQIVLCAMGMACLYFINQKQTCVRKSFGALCILGVTLVLILLERDYFLYNFLLIPVIIAATFYYLSHPLSITYEKNRHLIPGVIQKTIFLFFPVIALLGTNSPFAFKLSYTAFFWMLILAYYLFRINEAIVYRSVLYLTVIITMGIGFCGYFIVAEKWKGNLFISKYTVENRPQFNHIKLKSSQIDYFQRVDSLLQENAFDPERDRIFTTDYDYATLLYLGITNYGGLMHHIENMYAYDDVFYTDEKAPDFIIIRNYDRKKLDKAVQKFRWAFPDEYTKYEIGTPEDPDMVGKRSLFIRKREHTK